MVDRWRILENISVMDRTETEETEMRRLEELGIDELSWQLMYEDKAEKHWRKCTPDWRRIAELAYEALDSVAGTDGAVSEETDVKACNAAMERISEALALGEV